MDKIQEEFSEYLSNWKRTTLFLLLLIVGTILVYLFTSNSPAFSSAAYSLTPSYWITVERQTLVYGFTTAYAVTVICVYFLYFVIWSFDNEK